MRKIILIMALFGVILSSCTEDTTDDIRDNAPNKPTVAQTRSGDIEFDPQPNPYALDIMQDVYDSHSLAEVSLEPTDLYVRFLPKDSLQLNTLKYDYALELFDFPLDIDIPEDAVYKNPTIPEGEFTWQYTTVKPDFIFPENIPYEIIEQCYIPEEDEAIVTTRGGSVFVEDAAFLSLGYLLEEQEPETRAKRRPEGDIKVYDDNTGSYQPVKGVKIRCHRFIKWSTTFTDENGHYVMDSKFRFGPHYAIVFDNRKGFDIWGNWGPTARANHNMGWHSNKGHSTNIWKGSNAWPWCAVNNASYDYYKMCEATGITKPPKNLKIWVFKGWSTSSAAMLRRVYHPIGYNGNSSWKSFFINIGYGSFATVLNNMLKIVEPDITIGTKDKTYRDVYNLVNHELSHASHFSTVGSAYWAKYISYIMTYGSYGDGTGKNAELCGVGEMWGYSMGHIHEFEKYEPSGFLKPYRFNNGWLKPHVLWDIFRNNTLTKKQIYDCLTVDVDTYDKLVAKMYSKYPDKADAIETAFTNHGITPNVQKPNPNPDEIIYDAFYSNKTTSASYTFIGNNILSQNVTVMNNVKLTLRGSQSVTIKLAFAVNAGSQFVMALQ